MSILSLKSWVGDYTKDEMKKFFFLSFIFSVVIGVYWFLRTDKDSAFKIIVGYDWQPTAKIISVFFMIPLTAFYGYLISRFKKHQIFYVLSVLYGTLAFIFAFMLNNPILGISNIEASPFRFLGWAYYLYIESFGSIMVVLFWTFATDTTAPDVAKRWFPFMSFIAQFGSLFGSGITSGRFGKFSIFSSLIGAALTIYMMGILIYIFMKVTPEDQLKSYGEKSDKKEKRVGFLEALKAVFSHPYLLGIFFSIMIYEIVNTLFDYRFKVLVGEETDKFISSGIDPKLAGEMGRLKFNEWTGWVGEYMSITAIISYLVGLGNIGRKFGLVFSLIFLPSLLFVLSLIVGLSKSLLIVALGCVICKALNYAFYQPIKEQLYIPTSKESKYKSKAFIEMFGSRGSKAAASLINNFYKIAPVIFPIISLGASTSLCIIWLLISMYLGKTYEKAVSKNEVVC
jgi:AAA family ATP:ADP antiporter